MKKRFLILLFAILAPAAAMAENMLPAANQVINDPALDQDLIYRAAFGRAADVEVLLQNGANPKAVNAANVPAILVAVMNRKPEDTETAGIVQLLLNAGADPNTVGPKGELLVIEAIKNSGVEVVRVLLSNPDTVISVKDRQGRGLQAIAVERGDQAISDEIKKAIDAEIKRSQEVKSGENLRKLIQQYAFLNCANEYLNYYISMDSGKNMDAVSFKKVIDKNESEIRLTENKTKKVFGTESRLFRQIEQDAKTAIANELNAMQSDRQRLFEGVGSDHDLNKRCRRIANKWGVPAN